MESGLSPADLHLCCWGWKVSWSAESQVASCVSDRRGKRMLMAINKHPATAYLSLLNAGWHLAPTHSRGGGGGGGGGELNEILSLAAERK